MSSARPVDDAADPGIAYSGPDDLRASVIGALNRVIDPELALTIVDLGLVYGVAVAGDDVRVRLTMTSAACPVADIIVDDIRHELTRVLPASMAIATQLVWKPEWTSDRMSTRAKKAMGW